MTTLEIMRFVQVENSKFFPSQFIISSGSIPPTQAGGKPADPYLPNSAAPFIFYKLCEIINALKKVTFEFSFGTH